MDAPRRLVGLRTIAKIAHQMITHTIVKIQYEMLS
jgi:hypothetical protein